jgi:NACHT domain/TIR domain
MSDLKPSQPAQLFYVYAREDDALYNELETHLSPLLHEGLLVSHNERDTPPGEDQQQAVDHYLETASFILLLISANFLASDSCYTYQMPLAMERHNTGKARVIPIILRPCAWKTAPFGKLQVLPLNGQAISLWENKDQAFLEVEQTLRALLGQSHFPSLLRPATAINNREKMLLRLQKMYEELLADALQQFAPINLELITQPEAVQNAANLLLNRTTQTTQPLPTDTSIYQIYQDANQELLLLGAPGAGKSTLLYQLGRDLLLEAHEQPAYPLPIIFPLSSWAEKRLPIATWMAEQLSSPLYEVPRKQSQQWVQDEKILPLLDGLDEMNEEARPACISAINAYHHEHPLRPLVVCSRSDEYKIASTSALLHLQSAIEVQPLSPTQLDTTLLQAGAPFAALRLELTTNQDLHELARTPLWLTVLLLTFKDTAIGRLPNQRLELQQHLFQLYVQRMVEQKGDRKRYSLTNTNHYLSWLARQMLQREQSVFALELLHPDWLGKKLHIIYQWSLVLSVCLIIWLVPGLNFAPINRLATGLIIGLCIGLIKRLDKGRIKLAERIIWSWKKTLQGGFITWLIALLISWPLSWLLPRSRYWPFSILIAGLIYALLIGLIFGLSVEQYIERTAISPGEGLLYSLKNGVRIGLISGLSIGLLVGLSVGLFFWQIYGPSTGLLAASYGGLIFGFSFGLPFWLFFGVSPVAEHFLLRIWFWRAGVFPFRIKTFLEDARARHLLQRVGGSYGFVHRLLQNYFSDQESSTTPIANTVPSTTPEEISTSKT